MKKTFWAAFILMLCLIGIMMVGTVFAQEPDGIDFTFEDFGKILPATIMSALLTSILGYLKQTTPQNFELDKFIATGIIGFLVGVIMSLSGVDYATAFDYMAQGGLTIYVYWIAKIIAKKAGWIQTESVAPKSP